MIKYYMTVAKYYDKVVHCVEVYHVDEKGYYERQQTFIEMQGRYIKVSEYAIETPKPTDDKFIGCEITEYMFFRLIWFNK